MCPRLRLGSFRGAQSPSRSRRARVADGLNRAVFRGRMASLSEYGGRSLADGSHADLCANFADAWLHTYVQLGPGHKSGEEWDQHEPYFAHVTRDC